MNRKVYNQIPVTCHHVFPKLRYHGQSRTWFY